MKEKGARLSLRKKRSQNSPKDPERQGERAVSCMHCCQDESVLTASCSQLFSLGFKLSEESLTGLAWVICLIFGWARDSTWLTNPRRLPVGKGNPKENKESDRKEKRRLDRHRQRQSRFPAVRLRSSCHLPNHCELSDSRPHTIWDPQRDSGELSEGLGNKVTSSAEVPQSTRHHVILASASQSLTQLNKTGPKHLPSEYKAPALLRV